jgi:hypothetical protein
MIARSAVGQFSHALTVSAAVIDNRKALEMSILHNVRAVEPLPHNRMPPDTQKEPVQRDH